MSDQEKMRELNFDDKLYARGYADGRAQATSEAFLNEHAARVLEEAAEHADFKFGSYARRLLEIAKELRAVNEKKVNEMSEKEYAAMEGAMIAAVDEYMKARPQIDFIGNRRIYEAGFMRAYILLEQRLSAMTQAKEKAEAKCRENEKVLQRQVAMLHKQTKQLRSCLNDVASGKGGWAWEEVAEEAFSAINDTQAIAEAYDREHAAKVLEEAAKFFDEESYTSRDESGCVVDFAENVLRRKAETIRSQSAQKEDN